MLSVSKYPKAYVDACQRNIKRQIVTYRKLGPLQRAGSFEAQFLNHMLLALDHYFCHRGRGPELKDGNPLNELRMLCNSIMEGEGRLLRDSTIRYDASKSVLQLKLGDKIELNIDAFDVFAEAVFSEVRKKFT